jgi:RNA polymerase sigma factor (sigma-70 family)
MAVIPAQASEDVQPDVGQVVDHLFRREAGKMVATLTHLFGIDHLQLAEDVVQEALLKAMQSWSFHGVPQNPSAWIMQVAKNQALDLVRREQNFRSKEPEVTAFTERFSSRPAGTDSVFFDNEIKDDQLRMMFACCHPVLPRESQVALTLKTLCGFGETEIAAAFLTSTSATAKRLVRARQRIREARVPFEIPAGPELTARLDSVLQALYLLFNEGYKASQGEDLVRKDLCDEAIRLTTLLAEHPSGNQPQTHALLALMLLAGARLSTRVDAAGNLLLLADQDRSRWDRVMIDRGFYHLNLSAVGGEVSEFHLQAGIAFCHCSAERYESTDWPRILRLYDLLTEINPSPVAALNRAVAVSKVHGTEAGLRAVEQIPDRQLLECYHLYHSVLGQFHFESGAFAQAAAEFQRALKLTEVKAEQVFLMSRLKACEGRSASGNSPSA